MIRRALRCRWVACPPLLASLLLTCSLMCWPAGPAQAASNGLWSIVPGTAPRSSAQPFFKVRLTPGVPFASTVTIENLTSRPLDLDLYAADGLNTAGGGLSLRPPTESQSGIGGWTHLGQDLVTVGPSQRTTVPVVIDAPVGATPGDHLGGIVAEQFQPAPSSSRRTPTNVIQAVAVRVYARIPGPLHQSMTMASALSSTGGGWSRAFGGTVSVRMRFTVTNRGNTILSPRVVASLSNPFGEVGARHRVEVGQLLPGFSVTETVSFPNASPWGQLHASATAASGGLRASSSASDLLLPWGLIVLAVFIVSAFAAVGVHLGRRRRARRRRSAEGAAVGGDPRQPAGRGAP